MGTEITLCPFVINNLQENSKKAFDMREAFLFFNLTPKIFN